MTLRSCITPETIAAILSRANPAYKRDHDLNSHIPSVAACKIGATFYNAAGDLCVYTGLDGHDRKMPVRFVKVDSRSPMRGAASMLTKIAASN